jgi:LCP family protein required for cell wall assembly
MSRFERAALGFLILIALILWAAVAYRFKQSWEQPLGPQLALPTYTTGPGSTTDAESVATARPMAGPTSTFIPGQATLTPFVDRGASQPVCTGALTMTILLIGSSTHNANYLYGLADAIRLVRIDFVRARVTVLEFPRDLWVQIPNIEPRFNITHGKLNQPYFYGNKGMGYYKGPGEGPGLLARTLDLNFGARPDYYIAVNMQTFVHIVDALGGVNVYLPHNVDGRKEDQASREDLFFGAGVHHLNGEQALMLARIRQNTVFERADQQNRIFCAVRNALLNPKNLTHLPQIVDTFRGAVQTDLSPQQIGQLACLAPKLKPHNILFAGFPLDLLKGTRIYDAEEKKSVFIWDADFEKLRLYVKDFNDGTWPKPAPPVGIETPTPTNTSEDQTGFTCQ